MPRELLIDSHLISDDAPPFIIAEIGHNHASELKKAKQMVVTAKEAGASAVKFQTRNPREVYSPAEFNRESDNPQWMARKYGEHREKLEFAPSQWKELFAFCKDVGITAFSTPFDFKSADLLYNLNVPAFKIASGDATNTPLISYVAQMGKPMIVSTGGCDTEDVDRVYHLLSNRKVKFALLQCSCIYPAPDDVMNLNVVRNYRDRYMDVVVGLSTHHRSWYPSLAAYAMGARIFEHHYTNDKTWKGTDNHFSLDPEEMTEFVRACAVVRPAFGQYAKEPDAREVKPTIERRKKVVAARDIPVGAAITEADLAFKCPGDGIPPWQAQKLWGHRALRAFKKDEDIVMEGIAVKMSSLHDSKTRVKGFRFRDNKLHAPDEPRDASPHLYNYPFSRLLEPVHDSKLYLHIHAMWRDDGEQFCARLWAWPRRRDRNVLFTNKSVGTGNEGFVLSRDHWSLNGIQQRVLISVVEFGNVGELSIERVIPVLVRLKSLDECLSNLRYVTQFTLQGKPPLRWVFEKWEGSSPIRGSLSVPRRADSGEGPCNVVKTRAQVVKKLANVKAYVNPMGGIAFNPKPSYPASLLIGLSLDRVIVSLEPDKQFPFDIQELLFGPMKLGPDTPERRFCHGEEMVHREPVAQAGK